MRFKTLTKAHKAELTALESTREAIRQRIFATDPTGGQLSFNECWRRLASRPNVDILREYRTAESAIHEFESRMVNEVRGWRDPSKAYVFTAY